MKLKPTQKQQEASPATSADAIVAMVQIGSDLDQCRCLYGCAITLNPLSPPKAHKKKLTSADAIVLHSRQRIRYKCGKCQILIVSTRDKSS